MPLPSSLQIYPSFKVRSSPQNRSFRTTWAPWSHFLHPTRSLLTGFPSILLEGTSSQQRKKTPAAAHGGLWRAAWPRLLWKMTASLSLTSRHILHRQSELPGYHVASAFIQANVTHILFRYSENTVFMRFTKQNNGQKLNFDFNVSGEWLPGTRLSIFRLFLGSGIQNIAQSTSLYRLAEWKDGRREEARGGERRRGREGRKEGRRKGGREGRKERERKERNT